MQVQVWVQVSVRVLGDVWVSMLAMGWVDVKAEVWAHELAVELVLCESWS